MKAMETNSIRNVDISQIKHLPMIDFIGNDFAIFDSIQQMPIHPYPTRLEATCFSICLKGWCKIHINLKEYELSEGMMSIVLAGQIVQQGERSDDYSGIFLAVSKHFIDDVLPTMQQLFPLFFLIKENPCVSLSLSNLQLFKEYHSFLWKRVKLEENPFRKEITRGLLVSLLYEVYYIYQRCGTREHSPKSRRENLFEHFIRAISQSYKEERSISYYAEKMYLTAKYLSTVVKEVSGKTAGEWIDNLVILEAKALLKSSELTIQEIADELHFTNQSFFGKYFKRHTGVSPKGYRKL